MLRLHFEFYDEAMAYNAKGVGGAALVLKI